MIKPKLWQSVELESCSKFIGGAQPPRSTFVFSPRLGYVRMLQIRDYKSDDNATYIPEALSKRWCKADDVMIGRYGPPIFQILRGKEGSYNVALIKAEPKLGVDKRFLYYLLKQDALYRLIDKLSSRTSGQTGIDMDALNSFPVELPPLPEQRKIADILGTWDEALEKLDALITAKERSKQALMQQLLTGKRRLPGSPAQFQFLKASELFTNRTERNERGAPILSVTQDQGVVLRASLERKITHDIDTNDTYKVVHPGDYIISLRSFQGGLEYSEILGAVSPAYHVIHPVKSIDCEFYRHYFKSAHFVGHLATAVIGIRDGKQISFTDFGFIKLPYPHIEDQKRVGRILSAADTELRLLRQQRTALDQQKRGLMQQLLTGAVRVTTSN